MSLFITPEDTVIRLYDTIVSSDIALRLSYLEGLNAMEQNREREVLLARRYHSGDQGAQLTERLKQFLNETEGFVDPFRFNVCNNVVTAVSERLSVDAFDCDDLTALEWAQEFWQSDGLDAKQEEIHEGALRDGEYFGIVDWDQEEERPTVIPQQRYTSVEVGGDGQGCVILYEEDDPNLSPQVGVKYWTEVNSKEIISHRNLYYPDRIEKWVRRNKAEWELDASIPWTDATDQPLGIAMVHFKNKALRPEASDAWPLQRAINKSLLDLLASSDLTAFRIFVSLGFIPTTDGGPLKPDRSNLLPIEPGQVVGTTLPPNQASFASVEPSELSPLMDLTHQLVLWLATTTNTPVSRFISTKLIASDETLKEQEGPLIARARSRQITYGNAWGKCLKLAAKLQNTFGVGDGRIVNEDAVYDPIWADASARSQQERMELLLKKQKLGIPEEQLWREAGYSRQRIKQMLAMKKVEQRDALQQKQELMSKQEAQDVGQDEEGRESETAQGQNQDRRGAAARGAGNGTRGD